jgi:hypothetical protein
MASCFDDYITISDDIAPSRSGLYAVDLPGIDTEMLDSIARDDSESYSDIWSTIYKRARLNLVSDVSKNLAEKFFVDLKLLTRETSKFKSDTNSNGGYAGVTLEFDLPKYARLHIISVQVDSLQSYGSPGFEIKVFEDNSSGEVLGTFSKGIAVGKSTINIDSDFEVDKVFIAYNTGSYSLRQTESKYYDTAYNYFSDIVCDFCYLDGRYDGQVIQVNGGGLNVKYLVYCSAEKFVCENIKLFDQVFLYKIGQEITVERRLGERLSQFQILTKERWDELFNYYSTQYQQDLINVINQANIPEDPICYTCKNTVRTETFLA